MKGRLLRWTVLPLALIVAAALFWWGGPSVEFDDSDLLPSDRQTVAEEDGWVLLAALPDLIQWPEELDQAWVRLARDRAWDADRVAVWVADNRAALDRFDQLRSRTVIRIPDVDAWPGDADCPHLKACRRLAILGLLRAEQRFRSGDEAEAFADALEVVRLGHRLEDCGGPLIYYLTGAAVKTRGLRQIRSFTVETRLAPAELTALATALTPCEVNQRGLVEALKREYVAMGRALEDMATGAAGVNTDIPVPRIVWRIGTRPVLDVARSRQRFANRLRPLLEQVPHPITTAPVSPDDTVPRRSVWRSVLSGNAIGEILVDMLAPALDNVIVHKCRLNVNLRATRTLLALRAYHLETGALPDRLDALVPRYLDAVPVDDFGGQPLRYQPAERLLYSVGQDLIDAGGAEFDHGRQRPDIPFPIEF